MVRYAEYVGPVICEELSKVLPKVSYRSDWYVLPNGTTCLIGVQKVYATSIEKPYPVAIDLGGEQPFILWK